MLATMLKHVWLLDGGGGLGGYDRHTDVRAFQHCAIVLHGLLDAPDRVDRWLPHLGSSGTATGRDPAPGRGVAEATVEAAQDLAGVIKPCVVVAGKRPTGVVVPTFTAAPNLTFDWSEPLAPDRMGLRD